MLLPMQITMHIPIYILARRLRSSSRCIRLAVLTLAICVVTACGHNPPPDALHEGQLFPPLQLTGLDRADVHIDDLRGNWVVLNVWATWCAPCRKELGSLQLLAEVFAGQGLHVIGLNIDADPHHAREFMRDVRIGFANYSDPDMSIAQNLLGIRVYPDTFIIAPDGTLVRSISGEREWMSTAIVTAFRQALAGQSEALNKL